MTFTFRQFSERQLVLFIVAFSLIVRCATVAVLKIEPVSDYLGYDQMARNFLAGRGMSDDFGNAAFLSGGYPLFFLAPIYALFGQTLLVAQIGNALLGALSTYLVYLVLRETKAGIFARIVGPLMFALYVPSWIYAEYLAKENLVTPLLLTLVYLSARLHHNLSFGISLGIGTIIAVTAITGNAALSLLPITICAVVFANSSVNKKVLVAGIITLTAIVALMPWQYRNAQVVGSPVINTNGGFNLYLGNNPSANGYFVSIADTPRGTGWKELREKGEVYASEQLKIDAVTWITNNPAAFAHLAMKKSVLFWLPPFHEGKGTASPLEAVTRQIWLLQYIIVCAAAIYLLTTIRHQNRFVLAIFGGVVLYTGVHMLFYVVFRYREPIMPLVIILASLGFEKIFHRFVNNRTLAMGLSSDIAT